MSKCYIIQRGGVNVTWLYVMFGIVLLAASLWGWIARFKWTKRQADKIKK